MFNKLKQFKDLRGQAKTLQSKLSQQSAIGTAQGDKISITINGNQEITEVSISEELLAPGNKNRVEDGIKEAAGKALKKVQKIMAETMKDMGDFDFSKLMGGGKE